MLFRSLGEQKGGKRFQEHIEKNKQRCGGNGSRRGKPVHDLGIDADICKQISCGQQIAEKLTVQLIMVGDDAAGAQNQKRYHKKTGEDKACHKIAIFFVCVVKGKYLFHKIYINKDQRNCQ